MIIKSNDYTVKNALFRAFQMEQRSCSFHSQNKVENIRIDKDRKMSLRSTNAPVALRQLIDPLTE